MLNIITSSLLVLSSITGANTAVAATIPTSSTPIVQIAPIADEAAGDILLTPQQEKVQAQAEAFFKDEPVLVDVARCESSFRQYDTDGKVLIGTVNKGDIGVMQINKYYHADKAASLGDDLTTIKGNMAYAKYLYETQGLKPW